MTRNVIELNDASVIEDDVIKKIRTAGVRGLDFEKAKELGFFTRISNLLCVTHASIMAAYRVYGGVDYLLTEFGGRKNEIAREMNNFEKAFTKFINFWTGYYASGAAGIEMNEETEVLFRKIMEWSQLPYDWNLGDRQRIENVTNVAIRIDTPEGKQYTFNTSDVITETEMRGKESWCVTKYDTKEHKQVTVESDMDKASAMMVAKRLSSEDTENIYTASIVADFVEKVTKVTPYKAYKANEVIGKITETFR